MTSSQDHPYELLAAHVDGELDVAQRSQLDEHLEGCSACREELALAERARDALEALPALDVPLGLTSRVVERAGHRPSRLTERLTSRPVAWAAGAVAAAAVVVLAVVSLAGGEGGGNQAAPTAGDRAIEAASASPSARFPLVRSTENYNAQKLIRLAASLQDAPESEWRPAPATPGTSTPLSPSVKSAPAPTGETGSAGAGFDSMVDAATCVRSVVGSPGPADERLIRVIAARFEDTPAYIAAFKHHPSADQPANQLRIYVTRRSDCEILNYTSRPLG